MTQHYTVVTGASSGIGHAAAEALAARGHHLVLTARRRDRLEVLRTSLLRQNPHLDIRLHTADLAVPGQAEEFYDQIRSLPLRIWINNAGRGHYGAAALQDTADLRRLLELDVTAVAVLSVLFARDFRFCPGAQLINVSSCGGYVNVPTAVSYCAAKFFVSAFTEGLAAELAAQGASMRAKVFAPAATATEFGRTANHTETYDYDRAFPHHHTGSEAAELLIRLLASDATVGLVDRESFVFTLSGPRLQSARGSASNQKC